MSEEIKYDYSPMEWLIREKVTGKKCERNREILRLRFLRGLTYEEIAEIMDMSDKQVGRIIHRYGDPLLLLLAKGL